MTRSSMLWDRILGAIIAIFAFAITISGTAGSIVGGVASIAFVATWFWRRSDIGFRELKWVYVTAVLFVGWMILSALINGFDRDAASAIRHEWLWFVLLAVISVMKHDQRGRVAIGAFSIGCLLISVYAIGQFFLGWNFLKPHYQLESNEYGYWVVGNFSGSVTFGIFFAVASMFLLGYSFAKKEGSDKVLDNLTLMAGGLSLVGATLSGERGPMVAVLVTMILSAMVLRSKRVIIGVLVLVGVVVVCGLGSGTFVRAANLWNKEWSQLQDQGRWFIWTHSFRVAVDNPIFGAGPGNFRQGYAEVIPKDPPVYVSQGHAHNDYLMYAAQSGLVELAFFLILWWLTVWYPWKTLRASRSSGLAGQLAAAAMLGSICFGITSLFDIPFGHSTTRQLLMFIWGAGLAAHLRSEPAEGPSKETA